MPPIHAVLTPTNMASIANAGGSRMGSTRISTATSRQVRLGVVALFGAVMVALVLGVVGISLAIRPELAALVEISNDHARAVEVLTRLQGDLAQLRTRGVDRAAPPIFAYEQRLAEARDALRAFGPFAQTPTERDGLSALQASLASAGDAVATAANTRGDARRFSDAMSALSAARRRAGALAQSLIAYNAGEVQDASRRVRDALLTVMWLVVATAVLAVAVAGVLLQRALATLERYQGAVERHAEELDAFSARTAHELRTPLNALSLAVGAALTDSARPKALQRARAQVRRMSDTIDALLQFARAAGKPELGARCSVAAVVDEVATDAEPSLAQEEMSMVRDLEPSTEVAMSSSHLRTVLMNLVVNATKYGSAGPGSVVLVSTRRTGDRVALSVRDWGPGIPAEARSHVFEPLYRASHEREGYGLGLATVRRLVEAYGGSVTVDSSVGLGSVFSVDLPPAGAPG
jgi:signal transduction histidine kinase